MRFRMLFVVLALVTLAGQASAQTTVEVAASTLTVGASPTSPSGSSVRLTGLASSGGTGVLLTNASGDVVKRSLAKGDLPATTVYTDQANTFGVFAQSFGSTIGVTGLATLSGGFSAGASSSITGNLTLTGAARRITGDFSDATLSNRVMFQSSVTNGATGVYVMPNGTGSAAAVGAFNGSDPGNAGFMQLSATGTEVTLRSTATGSGTLLPMTLWAGGAERMRLATSGAVTWGAGVPSVNPTTGYAVNLGALGAKYLALHAAELWVETLVAQDTLATIGGRILVGPTTQLTADLSAGATSITVKHNNLANGDRVYLEAAGAVEFLAITSSASGSPGAYVYSVTRSLDPSGANDWSAGDAVFNTGTTGSGFIDLYSVRGVKASSEVGPTIVGNVRQSATYNDWAPRWAIGQLNGTYGYGVSTFGFAAGDPAGRNITVDPTNGVRLRNGTTDRMLLDANYLRFYGTDGQLVGYIGGTSGSPDIVLGSLASGKSYLGLSASQMSFCAAGVGCPLQLNGATGDITLAGNLELSTGGDIKSTGNFSLTQANGIKIESSSTGIGGGGDAAKRLWFPGGGSIYQFSDDVIVSAITASSGSPSIQLYAQRGACGTGITCYGMLEVIPSTVTATTRTQFVLTGSQTTGVGEAYYELLRGDSGGSLFLGNSTYYLGGIFWNGAQDSGAHYPMVWRGSDNQIVAKSDGYSGTFQVRNALGTGACTLTFEYGILTATDPNPC